MISLRTNMASLIVQKNLSAATKGLNRALEQLTTGYKLNHAKDNPADYAILKQKEAKLNSWNVASDNISIGQNMLESADSNAELIATHLSRIRDLCQQAANGTYGEQSVQAIKQEIMARYDEVKRIKENAEFNDIKLFGEYDKDGNLVSKHITLQDGIDSSAASRISVDTSMDLSLISDIENWDVTDSGCLDKIDELLNEISDYQVRIGAAQNRLDCALELAGVNINSLTSSISTLRDADIAEASSNLIRYQILQQACATLLATANQMPAIALQLI